MNEQMLKNRYNELTEEVKERSKHKNPMYYQALTQLRWARIVCALISGGEPSDEDVDAVCGIKLARQVSTPHVELKVKEGDNVMDILDKYRDVPNIHDKLHAAVKQAGLVVEGFYIRALK